MCSASLIFLLAFITQASQAQNAQDIMDTLVHKWVDRIVDKLLVDRMINKLFDPSVPNVDRFVKQVEEKPAQPKAPFVQSRSVGSGTSSMVRGTSSSIGGTSSMVRGTSSMIGGTSSIVKGKSSVIGGTSSIIHGTSSVIGGTSSIIHGTSSIIGGTSSVSGRTSQIRNWKYSGGENQEGRGQEEQREYTTPGGYKVPENLKILPKDSDQDKTRKRKAINAIKWQQRVNRKKEAMDEQTNSWEAQKKELGIDKRPVREGLKPLQADLIKDDGIQGMKLRAELPFLNPNHYGGGGAENSADSESSASNDIR